MNADKNKVMMLKEEEEELVCKISKDGVSEFALDGMECCRKVRAVK